MAGRYIESKNERLRGGFFSKYMLELFPSFALVAVAMYGWGRFLVPPGVTGGLSRIGWAGLAGFAVAFIAGAVFRLFTTFAVIST